MQVNHRNAARAERPPGWRAHRQGRESTGNGGAGKKPSAGPIRNRGRTATPQAAASQGAQRVPRCSQQPFHQELAAEIAMVTTPLTAQERVILFCSATGISYAALGITAHAMQSMAIKGIHRPPS